LHAKVPSALTARIRIRTEFVSDPDDDDDVHGIRLGPAGIPTADLSDRIGEPYDDRTFDP
jgi:hypothetical protein